jgi:hypothetical protein
MAIMNYGFGSICRVHCCVRERQRLAPFFRSAYVRLPARTGRSKPAGNACFGSI